MKPWILGAVLVMAHAAVADPWASQVIAYAHGSGALFTDVSKALGAPTGGGPSTPNNDSLVSLGGPGGYLILQFADPVTDDPDNPMGLDCIVFTNAFWTGGNPQVRWEEPALIEIAENASGPWYMIPGSRGYSYSPFPAVSEPAGTTNDAANPYLLAGSIRNPNVLDAESSNDQTEYNWGYAKLNPTAFPYLDNYFRPDNPEAVGLTTRSGGGDAFDIAWAVDADGQPAHLTQFRYIRLSSFIVRTMGALGVCSPDIDAVEDVAPAVDSDNDGILDAFETQIAGTDPNRPESTVLPLEIPALEGGSPAGTLLGAAQDAAGDTIRLYAAEQRTTDGRVLSANVDIQAIADSGPPLPSMSQVKSTCVRAFSSTVPDVVAAGIQPAEFVMHYTAAEIAGLDEDGLQPYRYENGTYTTADISGVSVNAAANRVTFRSRRVGVYILVSMPGLGDTALLVGPQGTIVLHADPGVGISVGEQGAFTSDVIHDEHAHPVADGTQITVAAGSGKILGADAAETVPGFQVLTSGGRIAFSVQAPSISGSAMITATSVEGAAYGEYSYAFFAGAPVPVIGWRVGLPESGVPVRVSLVSSVVRDAFGNPVRDGTLLTIVCPEIVSGDADLALPGHQVLTTGGRTSIVVEVPETSSLFTVSVYADATMTEALGEGTYSPADYVPMPLAPSTWILAIAIIGIVGLKRSYRKYRTDKV